MCIRESLDQASKKLGSQKKLATALATETGWRCDQRDINKWKTRGRVPVSWVLAISRVTKMKVDHFLPDYR